MPVMVAVEMSDRQLATLCAESAIAFRADIGGLGLAGLAVLPGDEQPAATIAIAPATAAHSSAREKTSERTGTSASGFQHNPPGSAASAHHCAKRRQSSALLNTPATCANQSEGPALPNRAALRSRRRLTARSRARHRTPRWGLPPGMYSTARSRNSAAAARP